MKNKGSVGFIFGGLIILLTLFDSSFAPWQIKLISGLGLLIYGLTLRRMKENNGLVQKWIFLVILILVFFGIGGYYYLNLPTPQRTYEQLQGTFEVPFHGRYYPGTAILDGDKLTFQFRVPGSSIKIDEFTLSNSNKIHNEPTDWICALKKDFNVIHCTTNPKALADYQQQFFDNGFFTIMFDFEKALEVDSIVKISFVMHTNEGDKNIRINSVQK